MLSASASAAAGNAVGKLESSWDAALAEIASYGTEKAQMQDLQQTMGTVIRRERRVRQMTRKVLAERSAISEVYLGEIERGQKYPSALVLERLANALDLGIPDLLESMAEEMRGVAVPRMAIGFLLPEAQPAPSRTTPTGTIISMLVA